jgi:hypothetical protein
LNTARNSLGGAGTNTASVVFGGQSTTQLVNTESWNGSAWTEVNDLNQTTANNASAGATYTDALNIGGYETPPQSRLLPQTESWNGTIWSRQSDMNTARAYLEGSPAGSSTASLAIGGGDSPFLTQTEEWFGDGHVTEKISSS